VHGALVEPRDVERQLPLDRGAAAAQQRDLGPARRVGRGLPRGHVRRPQHRQPAPAQTLRPSVRSERELGAPGRQMPPPGRPWVRHAQVGDHAGRQEHDAGVEAAAAVEADAPPRRARRERNHPIAHHVRVGAGAPRDVVCVADERTPAHPPLGADGGVDVGIVSLCERVDVGQRSASVGVAPRAHGPGGVTEREVEFARAAEPGGEARRPVVAVDRQPGWGRIDEGVGPLESPISHPQVERQTVGSATTDHGDGHVGVGGRWHGRTSASRAAGPGSVVRRGPRSDRSSFVWSVRDGARDRHDGDAAGAKGRSTCVSTSMWSRSTIHTAPWAGSVTKAWSPIRAKLGRGWPVTTASTTCTLAGRRR
jgi:hypothetical protein